jgi:5-methyltetrahydropteroyltriglutamate--homocysteine methyltransferase
MLIPTEPIGSIPRPLALQAAMRALASGTGSQAEVDRLGDEAVRDTIARFEATGLAVGDRVFIGVTDPINARVEAPDEVRDRVLEAAAALPIDRLGTTDDCGFAPFADDTSTARETAFAMIRARVEGTALASQALGV